MTYTIRKIASEAVRKNYSVSVVIPARNEESTIGTVLEEAVKLLPKITKKYEILINDDASSDKTSLILEQFSQKHKNILVFHQKKALGISGGFEFLYKRVKNELIFTLSADGEFSIKDLPKMIAKIYAGFDLVIGQRRSKKYSFPRKLISFMFNFLPKLLFGVDLYDAGSIKLYKKEVLKDTTPLSKSVFNEAERIIRSYKLGYKITSVQINYSTRQAGQASGAKLNNIILSFIDMLKLRFSL